MSPKAQPSAWLGGLLVIEQALAGGVKPPLPLTTPRVQVTPEPGGSPSLKLTLVAVAGPPLLTLMSKPMSDPAPTGDAGLAVLVMARLGAHPGGGVGVGGDPCTATSITPSSGY